MSKHELNIDIFIPFSFFASNLVKYIVTIVNHNLVLDSKSFLLTWIEHLTFFLISRSWYLLLFSGIYKQEILENISLLLQGFEASVLLYIFCGIGIWSLINCSIFWCPCKCYSDPNQRESRPKCNQCTNDSAPKA
jgi:hypothetical protein